MIVMKVKSKILRVLSLFLALCMTLETLLPADIALAFQSQVPAAMEPLLGDKNKISEFARVEWLKAAPSVPSRGVVYLIQDAHSSLLAQKRITETLQYLKKQKVLDAVLIEGASEKLTAERFAHIPNLSKQTDLITNLERQGYLHGAAVFALLNPEVSATGMESPELYRANFELFREVMKSEKEVQRAVSAFQVEWQRWLKTRTQKEDYDFFFYLASSHALSEDSGYFEQLIAMASRELGIQWNIRDQKDWPNLIRLQRMLEIQPKLDFKKAREEWLELKKLLPAFAKSEGRIVDLRIHAEDAGNSVSEDAPVFRRFAEKLVQELIRKRLPLIPYRAFFDWLAISAFQAEIEPEGLILEIEKLENQIWDKKFQSKEDRRAAKLGRMAILFDQAGRLELSRGAVRRFQAMVESDEFRFWFSKLLPEKKQFIIDFSTRLLQFYAVAERREAAFFEKLNRAVDTAAAHKSSLPYVAVVAGGYHKDGLLELLKADGFDIAVLTPKLDRIDHDVAYRERMLEPAFETSTLSMVPAAAVSPAELPDLVGEGVAQVYEADLHTALADDGAESRSEMRLNRRSFLKAVAAGFVAMTAGRLVGQESAGDLLKQAAELPFKDPVSASASALFPLEKLQLQAAGGMDGYLNEMMARIRNADIGLFESWNRVLIEAKRLRGLTIGITLNYSGGSFSPGLRMDSSGGHTFKILNGGMSMAMEAIGFLLDAILVMPVRNQADRLALEAGDLEYQWKMRQLAGEVARLLILLRAEEAKLKIAENYIRNLEAIETQIAALVKSGAMPQERLLTAQSFLNEAKDSRNVLQAEIQNARIGLTMLLGDNFDFTVAGAPLPTQKWLNAKPEQAAALTQAAIGRAGQTLAVRAANLQTAAAEKDVKAAKRGGILQFFIRTGPANPDKKREELGLETRDGKKLGRRPEVAQAQVATEQAAIQARILQQQLNGVAEKEIAQFFREREAHARWQAQVYGEQTDWQAKGLVAPDYDLVRLTLLKRFVNAQLRVMETRAEMSGAISVLTAAGFENESARSGNWMKAALFSDLFPQGFVLRAEPVPPKRSEARILKLTRGGFFSWIEKRPGIVRGVQAGLLGVMIMGPIGTVIAADADGHDGEKIQLPLPGSLGPIILEYQGLMSMSSATGDQHNLMPLRFPENVIVHADGRVSLDPDAQVRYEAALIKLKDEARAYLAHKSAEPKLLELLPRFRAIFDEAMQVDRLQRVQAAFQLAQEPDFQVMNRQAGAYSLKQPVMELVSKRVAKVQVHVPLHNLIGSEMEVEIAGKPGRLIAPPRVLEPDTLGDNGIALIELTVLAAEPMDLAVETAYRLRLKKSDQPSVSSGEPVQILAAGDKGEKISLGVGLLKRQEVPVVAPDFGVASLAPGVQAGYVMEQTPIAAIQFQDGGLDEFFRNESGNLADQSAEVLPRLQGSSVLSPDQQRLLEQAVGLREEVAASLQARLGISSPASGILSLTPKLAAGFPVNDGDQVAFVRTARMTVEVTILNRSTFFAEGSSVQVRLADGRELPAQVRSVTGNNTGRLSGRTAMVLELDVPPSLSEVDWSSYSGRPDFSIPGFYEFLARAHQRGASGPGNVLTLDDIEFGVMGKAAALAQSWASPDSGTSLAELIGVDTDPVRAHQEFKKHRDKFGASDYSHLLESMHLSLAHEAAKFMVREKGEWAEVLRALQRAQANGGGVRARARYDALVMVLISGDARADEGLKKLGAQARTDPGLRNIANAFFAVLAAERGWDDPAVQRILHSQLWTLPELAQLALGLKASPAPEMQRLSGGVTEWIWRSLANSQIAGIENSPYREALLKGNDPQSVLVWLSQKEVIEELVYRRSLAEDGELLTRGSLDGAEAIPPPVAALIDPETAKHVALPQVQPGTAVPLLPGILGEFPATLGEFDILTDPAEQQRFLEDAAAAGDLEFLTWVLISIGDLNFKKAAIALLKNAEQGPVVFARWFAWYADEASASAALSNYGIDLFWSEILTEVEHLELLKAQPEDEKSAFHPLQASKRQVVFDSVLKMLVQHSKTLGKERTAAAERLLLMLIMDPADLGSLARDEDPISIEAREFAEYASRGGKQIAEEELARRALLFAIHQFPELVRKERIAGESRLGKTANQIAALKELLLAGVFSSQNPFSEEGVTMLDRIVNLIRRAVPDENDAEVLIQLAQKYYEAGWSGDVTVPSETSRHAGLFQTILNYTKNLLALFVMVGAGWLFFKQARVKFKKIQAMRKGDAVQFYDNIDLWRQNFKKEVVDSGLIRTGEGKESVVRQLTEWGDLLAQPSVDYQHVLRLAREVFKWGNLSMRVNNFKGFRHDDRIRDRILIYALMSLVYLTLKKIADTKKLTPEQKELYDFLRLRSHRLVIFSYILFQLKNLKENESYNAVYPNVANSVIMRERMKVYEFQKNVWGRVRWIYAMDRGSSVIRSSLNVLVEDYQKVSEELGDPLPGSDVTEIRELIQTRYQPRERLGASPDNAASALNRKLVTRVFNFIAFLGALPLFFGFVKLTAAWFAGIGFSSVLALTGFVSVASIMIFVNLFIFYSAFTYLSHLFANLANLHDIQAEEFMNFLSDTVQQIDQLPLEKAKQVAAPPGASKISLAPLPADEDASARFATPRKSPAKETLKRETISPSAFEVKPKELAENKAPHLVEPVQRKTEIVPLLPAKPARPRVDAAQEPLSIPVKDDQEIITISQWKAWQADPEIAAVVVFVPTAAAEKEEKALTALSGRHGLTKLNVDDFAAGIDLNARMLEVHAQILGLNPKSQRIIFLETDSQGRYRLMSEKVTFQSASQPPKLLSADEPEKSLEVKDLLDELESAQKKPGFDAVVVTVNQEDADALRPVIKNLIQKKYGYPVPVAVIGAAGVSGGNGVPALGAFTDRAQMDNELRKDNPLLPGVDRMKLIVLEAYGPDLDIANLTAGSIFLSPTGIKDRRGNAVTTGALALARAAISIREVKTPAQFRFKTDTYSLNRLRSHLPGDITFAVTELSAREVVGRFGVPIFSDKKRTKIKGFFEKVDTFEKLQHLYKQRTGIEITPDTKIPVFTGDIALQFKTLERQEAFQNLTLKIAEFHKTALQKNPVFQLDEVLDFWVPLIMAEGKPKGDIEDLLVSYAGYRAKVSNDGKPRAGQERIEAVRVYSQLYFEILKQVNDSGLKLSIHGIVDQGEFSDVRDVEPLARLNLANVKAATPIAAEREPDSETDEENDEHVTTFGLNGNKPSVRMKGLLMASAPMRSGQETFEAIVFGMRGSWGIDRLHGFEETHLGFDTGLFVDESDRSFLRGMEFRRMPLFPTRLTTTEQTNRLVAAAKRLSEGKKVRVSGGAESLRKAGYVSLEDILRERDFRGIESPVLTYSVEGPARRSELRTLTQLVRTGAAVATLVVFLGILPLGAEAGAVFFEKYAGVIMRNSVDAVQRSENRKVEQVQAFSPAVVSDNHTLFIDGKLTEDRELLQGMVQLSKAGFKIEILFESRQKMDYDKVRSALGGEQVGVLKIRLGTKLGEMITNATKPTNLTDEEHKKNFAFLTADFAVARRVRGSVANIMVLEKNTRMNPALLLEALLSPAIFQVHLQAHKGHFVILGEQLMVQLAAALSMARSA